MFAGTSDNDDDDDDDDAFSSLSSRLDDRLKSKNNNISNNNYSNNNNNNYSNNNDRNKHNGRLVTNDNVDNTIDGSDDSVNIPTGGFSVSDEMDNSQRDRFMAELIPIVLPGGATVAQIVTETTVRESIEPLRYVIPLLSITPLSTRTTTTTNVTNTTTTTTTTISVPYVLVDVPPYSNQLANSIRQFMAGNSINSSTNNDTFSSKGILVGIVITNRDSIHYDDAPAVYSTRRSDLDSWKRAFHSDLSFVVGYRLDVPRDCRSSMTQILDGYGPFALSLQDRTHPYHSHHTQYTNDNTVSNTVDNTVDNTVWKFIETGRPLTYAQWTPSIVDDIKKGKPPPDDDNDEHAKQTNDGELYTDDAIREREKGKPILAVYTPGHSFGSMSYVFPELGLCCSGYTIPVEDNSRFSDNDVDSMDYGSNPAFFSGGPILDCSGYITTTRGGIERQMESARNLINKYIDRFHVVLPSRGDPLVLPHDDSTTTTAEDIIQNRKDQLLQLLEQYEKVGTIYEQLGIVASDDSNKDDDDYD